jgi:ABC-type oligopeptide transport system substrate-binding subunit/class 3 adenylate cyclase
MAVVVAGERRIVSVLFTDVVGSTAIGEQLGPERTKLLLDEVIRLMSEQVERFGGTVAQLLGDGLLALFGAPVAFEDDSERAVRAALAIQRSLVRYAQEVEAAYDIRLAVRIAVNTGPVVFSAEVDGGNERYNALGDTVNVAARLQELADPGGVVVGSETARRVDDSFELEPLGNQELKGLTTPVETFRVTCELEWQQLPPAHPLVGRDFELTVLERALEGLAEGRGVIVSLMGEPGIGKSRLLWEVRSRYRDRVRFVEGRAVSYAQSFPFNPIRDLLREWLGATVTTPEARVRLDLKAELGELFGKQADHVYPFLATLLGLSLDSEAAERLRELNRESIQHQSFEVFAELARRLSEERPLCLVFEDLHWADESSIELIEALLPAVESASLGLFLLHRAEREHGSWRLGELARQRYPHRYRELELRPLAADASRALAHHAAQADLPEAVAELLAVRAGGNPFFLEEALRDLVERGALRREDGHFELAVGVDELAIPTAVQGALQARLDRLDANTRDLVSIAAVVGRTFGMPLLERLVEPEQLLVALSELQRLDLIVEQRRRPAPEYRFRHGLVQEVAYARLIEPKRRKLHRLVGEALEELHPDSREDVYGLLARHFSEADEPSKAADYLLAAGDAARALSADQEALDHYRRAKGFLRRIGDERRERDTLFKIALAHHLAFDFAEAEAAYDEALCCRVEDVPGPEPAELLRTAVPRPDSVIPGLSYWTEGMFFAEHLFRGLLRVDRDLNVLPAVADNFRVSADGRSYLFRLHNDARWSDGRPVTAGDFVFAWDRRRAEGSPTAFLLADVESAEAHDERTLEVRLREPRNYFLYTLATVCSFPWPRHKVEELGDDWMKPEHFVGNGPLTLAELDEHGARLVANPHWHGQRGAVKELRVTFVDGGPPDLDDWRTGAYDVLESSDARLRDEPDTVSEIVPELALRFVGFRATKAPFSSQQVRQAFSLAVDREQVAAALVPLSRPATGGVIPPSMPGHSPSLCPEPDLGRAKQLLADAGYPDGDGLPELELVAPDWATSLEPLLGAWEQLGARVRVKTTTGHFDIPYLHDSHFWLSGWTADFPDPDGFFRGLGQGKEWPFYEDEEILYLLEEARSLRDRDARIRLYQEVDRLWVQERATILPLAYTRRLVVRRPWVKGVRANPLSRILLDEVVVEERQETGLETPDQESTPLRGLPSH